MLCLFEDENVKRLYPVTVGKPAFDISCGSFRLLDVAQTLGTEVRAIVRPHLTGILEADGMTVGLSGHEGSVLLVNARLVPRVELRKELASALAGEGPCMASRDGTVLWARLPAAHCPTGPAQSTQQIHGALLSLGLPGTKSDAPLFDYPHDIVRHHLMSLGANLELRLAQGSYQEILPGVFAAPGAKLGEHAVTDTRSGPIVLERDATVGPFCFLRGPAHLGQGARLIEQSAVKDCVALGHTTKIGGEVEGSIIEPYTNKQHHGFLGHSYLGSWVNLGAGTCNSDLKNTYGHVNMEYQGLKVPTGMQFLGAIVGDYAKTAINTGIFTGKTVGVCSMLYGFVTTNVPSFVNYARLFGQVTEAPVEVMVATQARMFARRKVEQRPCDIQLLHDMYELTRHERQLAGEPLAL
jgi:glucose-1-phosphate thymidylyltransferase